MNYPPLPLIVRLGPKTKLLAERDYYNLQCDRLGDRFYQEMLEELTWLEANYNVPPVVQGHPELRRYVTNGKFRRLIYFRVQQEEIVVASIIHPSQRPRY